MKLSRWSLFLCLALSFVFRLETASAQAGTYTNYFLDGVYLYTQVSTYPSPSGGCGNDAYTWSAFAGRNLDANASYPDFSNIILNQLGDSTGTEYEWDWYVTGTQCCDPYSGGCASYSVSWLPYYFMSLATYVSITLDPFPNAQGYCRQGISCTNTTTPRCPRDPSDFVIQEGSPDVCHTYHDTYFLAYRVGNYKACSWGYSDPSEGPGYCTPDWF